MPRAANKIGSDVSADVLPSHTMENTARSRAGAVDALKARSRRLLAEMQTPAARRGMKAAFNATPEELGRGAVEAARKLHTNTKPPKSK